MAIKLWDSTAWKMASQIKVWDGSAWRETSNANVHIWTGSAWQKVHPGATLPQDLTVTAFDGLNVEAQADLILWANGKIQTFTSTSGGGTVRETSSDWLLTATTAEYDVFVTNFTGDALIASAPVDGTRSVLSSTRSYTLQAAGSGENKIATFELNICANTGTGTVIQKTDITLSAQTGL